MLNLKKFCCKNYILFILICFLTFQANYSFAYDFDNKESLKTSLSPSYFVDKDVKDFEYLVKEQLNQAGEVFHLFSHGKPGQLLINGTWMNSQQIGDWWIKNYGDAKYAYLNIYGCNFAKGEQGRDALTYLENQLGISIAASDDLTGTNGDWELEVGTPIASIELTEYPYNLQCCSPSLTNFALSGTASSLTQDLGFSPSFANDNNTNTFYASNGAGLPQWWQVNLGQPVSISNIIVNSRTDCCQDRIQGAIVEILDFGGNVVFTYTIPDAAAQECIEVGLVEGQTVRISAGPTGSTDRLDLAEVEVYGIATEPAVYAIPPTCTNNVASNDGYLSLVNANGASTVNFSVGSTYTGPTDINDASNITVGAIPQQIATGLSGGPQDYTVRLWFGANCFIDVPVLMAAQDCQFACECIDMVYVNVPKSNLVEKFSVNPDGSLTAVAIPWVTGVNEAHGLSSDINGNIYVGSLVAGNDAASQIYKFDCDGNFIDFTPFNVQTQNHVIVDGVFYTNLYSGGNNTGGWKAFDVCTGDFIGQLDTDGPAQTWATSLGEDGLVYGVGQQTGNVYQFPADPSLFTDPPTNSLTPIFNAPEVPAAVGIDQDEFGNIYIASITNDNVYKYDSSGNLLGFGSDTINAISGLIYIDGFLYVSSQDENAVCIGVYEAATMTYRPDLSIDDGFSKAISSSIECCPTNRNVAIDTTLCLSDISSQIFLRNFYPCEGPLCGGSWQEEVTNAAGFTFDDCSSSISVTAEGCGTFSLNSDGTGNSVCGPFNLSVNICVEDCTACAAPNPEIAVTDNDCAADIDGTFTIVQACGVGYTLEWSTDGGANWSATTPAYNAEMSMMVMSRCIEDADPTCLAVGNTVTSNPEECCPPVNCINQFGEFTITKRRP